MVWSPGWSSLVVARVTQPFLPQHTIEFIDAQAAQVVNKILRNKNFFRVHSFAQQVFAHIGDGLFAQFWSVAQTPGMALELRCAAFQQHFGEHARPLSIFVGLECTNC